MATTILQPRAEKFAQSLGVNRLPALPWRDPHSVPPGKLSELIASLQEGCTSDPTNADLRTCLGMAHAMNYDVYRSMDALEDARRIEPENFLAQMKYAELHYRIRALDKAEAETERALELACTGWELALARRQLGEIRRLRREGIQRPAWTKSLKIPGLGLVVLMSVISCLYLIWK